MVNKSIENSLVEVIGESGGFDLLVDASELALDELLKEGVLKEVPIVGIITKLYRAGVGVKGYLFVKKLTKFIASLSKIPEKERIAFTRNVEGDPQLKKQIGENLLLILDRLDDLEKPELVGRAFQAYVKGRINFEAFRRLALAIDRCLLADLQHLSKFDRSNDVFPDIALNLSSCGLIEISTVPSIRGPGAKNQYQITEFGELFQEIILEGH